MKKLLLFLCFLISTQAFPQSLEVLWEHAVEPDSLDVYKELTVYENSLYTFEAKTRADTSSYYLGEYDERHEQIDTHAIAVPSLDNTRPDFKDAIAFDDRILVLWSKRIDTTKEVQEELYALTYDFEGKEMDGPVKVLHFEYASGFGLGTISLDYQYEYKDSLFCITTSRVNNAHKRTYHIQLKRFDKNLKSAGEYSIDLPQQGNVLIYRTLVANHTLFAAIEHQGDNYLIAKKLNPASDLLIHKISFGDEQAIWFKNLYWDWEEKKLLASYATSEPEDIQLSGLYQLLYNKNVELLTAKHITLPEKIREQMHFSTRTESRISDTEVKHLEIGSVMAVKLNEVYKNTMGDYKLVWELRTSARSIKKVKGALSSQYRHLCKDLLIVDIDGQMELKQLSHIPKSQETKKPEYKEWQGTCSFYDKEEDLLYFFYNDRKANLKVTDNTEKKIKTLRRTQGATIVMATVNAGGQLEKRSLSNRKNKGYLNLSQNFSASSRGFEVYMMAVQKGRAYHYAFLVVE